MSKNKKEEKTETKESKPIKKDREISLEEYILASRVNHMHIPPRIAYAKTKGVFGKKLSRKEWDEIYKKY